jgi:hypothetical protein
MPTRDGSTPDHPLPRFLSKHDNQPIRLPIVAARKRTVGSSRVVVVTSALIGMTIAIMILTVEDPVALFADVRTSLLEISAFQPGVVQSTAVIQSTPHPDNLPPIARDTPRRQEIAAAPAEQSQTRINQASTEDLLKQFQAWAAEEDKQAKIEPVRLVQDVPEQVVQDDLPKLRIIRTERQVWRVRHARAEMRSRQISRRIRQAQNARAQVRPSQDAPAQAQPVQGFSSRD